MSAARIQSRFAIAGVAFVLVAALTASLWPLLIYSVTLAVFGLPHVIVEMRYLRARFGARIDRSLLAALVTLLSLVVLLRVAQLLGFDALGQAVPIELWLVIALAATVLPLLVRTGVLQALVGASVLFAIGVGVLRAPVATIVLLAVLHNVTPVGFLAEALSGRARRRAMIVCALLFGVVPLYLASGHLVGLLERAGRFAPDASWLTASGLSAHLSVFVPPALLESARATPWFVAAAYLQCMHYGAVMYVLPRLPGAQRLASGAPAFSRRFVFLTAAAAGVFLLLFVTSFETARPVYGVFAAVHAWIEIPVLLLALARPAPSVTEVAVAA